MSDTPDLSEFRAITREEELQRLLSESQRQLRIARERTADLVEAVRTGARDAWVILGNPPEITKPKRDRRGKPEAALLHLSDWQYGKATVSYNSQVADERLTRLGEKLVELTEIERAAHPVTECHLLLGGDMVENVDIFPGQAFEVDSGLFSQIIGSAGNVERLVRTALATFETVVVWEAYGNHGRLGRKGDHPKADNADLLVYRLAQERLSGYGSRLTWHQATSWYQIVEVGDYRALLIHGDQIKSFGGQIPAFGIAKKVNAWATGVIEPFTDCMLGHFHQPLAIPLANGRGRAFVNPSIESDSIYAKEFVAATGTPGQRLHFIDPEKGRITSERILWID